MAWGVGIALICIFVYICHVSRRYFFFAIDTLLFISFFKIIILLLFNYSCLHFPPTPPPTTPAKPISPPCFHPPCPGFVHVSLIVVPENSSPRYPFLPPLWLLSNCSQFLCLWLYFACFFLLLIMFQLKVRSYDICPLPPGLLHLS